MKRKGKSTQKPKKKDFGKGAKLQKTPKLDAQTKDPSAGMRLNKYIANSGMCSRREADIYIAAGNVQVNGKVVTEMGYKVKLSDEVKFDGRRITPEKKEYILLNKPSGIYVTGSLHKGHKTVMQLIANASKAQLAPVGNMETGASGLLLFTNDGTLAKSLAKPKHGIRQIFHVELDKNFSEEDLEKIREGIFLEEGKVNIDDISHVEGQSKRQVGIELKSTKPKVVQRLFKKLGYEVLKLDRVVYGGLTKKDLPRGRYRQLTQQEIINLGMI